MDLTSEVFEPFVDGQFELHGPAESVIYRGEIADIWVSGSGTDAVFAVRLRWLARSELPSRRWINQRDFISYVANAFLCTVHDIGPGPEGEGSRLRLRFIASGETVILYPPGGSKLDPGLVEGLNLDRVLIADLGCRCTFDIGYHGTRTSPLCGEPATSLLPRPDSLRPSPRGLRCEGHRGMIDDERHGRTVDWLPRQLAKVLAPLSRT